MIETVELVLSIATLVVASVVFCYARKIQRMVNLEHERIQYLYNNLLPFELPLSPSPRPSAHGGRHPTRMRRAQ